ncbi:MAG TPA: hypothetical protein ENK57_16220 [Polyangiaceae bacterium]|nr:hypothetical protein [Polyangiaceae bacterium]
MSDELPPCGIYLTTAEIGGVPSGRLVYFHNHGDPGAGIYLPSRWKGNRARFEGEGHLLPTPEHARHLEPLPREGLYRVEQAFHCCDKHCQLFETNTLVQLGYDGSGQALIFLPQWIDGQLAIPERGTRVDRDRIEMMARLNVPVADTPVHDGKPDDVVLH